MNKRLKLFYYISGYIILLFFSVIIVSKAFIWNQALKVNPYIGVYQYRISFYDFSPQPVYRYTTEPRQKFFYEVNQLFAPAFILIFVITAVKLVKREDIFKEQD